MTAAALPTKWYPNSSLITGEGPFEDSYNNCAEVLDRGLGHI
ncbi:unannotated protein [freshwater metagenome]|uniref:Unannotated protein n=1 Tax=freshwater metagenome TaxID=449393 RepID=A0A6J7GDL8_9ZZZZ